MELRLKPRHLTGCSRSRQHLNHYVRHLSPKKCFFARIFVFNENRCTLLLIKKFVLKEIPLDNKYFNVSKYYTCFSEILFKSRFCKWYLLSICIDFPSGPHLFHWTSLSLMFLIFPFLKYHTPQDVPNSENILSRTFEILLASNCDHLLCTLFCYKFLSKIPVIIKPSFNIWLVREYTIKF